MKNQSIRKVFQYKFTIKPVIFCEVDFQKRSNISEKALQPVMIWDGQFL